MNIPSRSASAGSSNQSTRSRNANENASEPGHGEEHAALGDASRLEHAARPASRASSAASATAAALSPPASASAQRALDPMQRLRNIEMAITCPISYELLKDAHALSCGHLLNRDQIARTLESTSNRCPTCRDSVIRDDTVPAVDMQQFCRDYERVFPGGANAATREQARTFVEEMENGTRAMPLTLLPRRAPRAAREDIRPVQVRVLPHTIATDTPRPFVPAVAMVHRTPADVLPSLARHINMLLRSPFVESRRHTIAAAVALYERGALPALATRLVIMAGDSNRDVSSEARLWLQQIGTHGQQATAIIRIQHTDDRRAALMLLAQNIQSAQNPEAAAQRDEAVRIVNELLTNALPENRRMAVAAWATLQGPQGAQRLVEMVPEGDFEMWCEVRDALAQIGTPGQQAMANFRYDAYADERSVELMHLAQNPGVGDACDDIERLINAWLVHPQASRRREGVIAWATLQGPQGLWRLQQIARNDAGPVAEEARRQIERLSGRARGA